MQNPPPQVPEISPEELKRKLDAKEDVLILDVRDPQEYETANLGGLLIPLKDLPNRMGELDKHRPIVVH